MLFAFNFSKIFLNHFGSLHGGQPYECQNMCGPFAYRVVDSTQLSTMDDWQTTTQRWFVSYMLRLIAPSITDLVYIGCFRMRSDYVYTARITVLGRVDAVVEYDAVWLATCYCALSCVCAILSLSLYCDRINRPASAVTERRLLVLTNDR